MSATEDETQSLDAGWDDAAPSEPDASEPEAAEIDEAWDSLPPPSAAVSVAPSVSVAAEEVDSGWDDVPAPTPGAGGKRRPHRQRRTRASAVEPAPSPLVMPRPAEPTKKHQRELARKQRAHAALVREQRKSEQKAQRAAEAREEAAARLSRARAEEQARLERQAAREREREAQRSAKPRAPKPAPTKLPSAVPDAPQKGGKSAAAPKPVVPVGAARGSKTKLGPGVLVTLAVLLAVVLLLVVGR